MIVPFNKAKLSYAQEEAMNTAKVGFMVACPFFAHYYYGEMIDYPTHGVPTAATDGRRLYYNPDYLYSLKHHERVFVLAHEVMHAVMRHSKFSKSYRLADNLRGLPWDHDFYNVVCDWIINRLLMDEKVGQYNPSWLYNPHVLAADLPEDVYVKWWKQRPPPPGGGNPGNPGNPGSGGSGSQPGSGSGSAPYTFKDHGTTGKAAKPDKVAEGAGGRFDQIFEPMVDPASGAEDAPTEMEFKEAIARAAAAAKAMGKMPATFQSMIDEIMDAQVSWKDYIRMLLTGKLGMGRETWERPNRRRLVLNPMIYIPGRRGFGADTVVIGLDTSGSIGQKELDSFFGEVGGILQDVKPKRIILLDCDADIAQVREARSVDDFGVIREQGAKGGGGTNFRPVFEWCEKEMVKPDALVYLTDMYGDFPDKAPAYPVIWCATSDVKGPFGDTVHIEVK